MPRRKFLWLWVVLAVSGGFLISPASAATPVISEFNPICWTQAQCDDARGKILNKTVAQLKAEGNNGWVSGQPDCPGAKWGKCLPAGIVDTQVAFAGRRRFLHLGDFILTMYRYTMGIAGIVAAMVLVRAGFIWTTSGGNSEAITSAKKQIGGAIIGVLIAYLSYVVLNTINPALVNLRLPQVWMIRPQSLVPEFCSSAPETIRNDKNFALVAGSEDQMSFVQPSGSPSYNFTFKNERPEDRNERSFFCGKRFLIKDSGAVTCFGGYCDRGQVCVDFDYAGKPQQQKYYCKPGMLAGRVSGVLSIVGAPVQEAGDNIKLIAMCTDGSIEEVYDVDNSGQEGRLFYQFPATSKIETVCGASNKLLGFYLGVEVNDETGGIGGQVIPGSTFSWGMDDWFAVGQAAPGSHLCNVNLGKVAYRLAVGQEPPCTSFECSCSVMNYEKLREKIVDDLDSLKPYLLTLDNLKNGYQCSIEITRADFPAVDNALLGAAFAGAGTSAAITRAAFLPLTSFGVSGIGGFVGAFLDDPTGCDVSFKEQK